MPPSLRRARPSRFVSPTTHTQAPWWLRSAALAGSDSPSKMLSGSALSLRRSRRFLTPHAVNCGRLGRLIEHPSRGLAGIPEPLRPLEDVGPSVYRCGMRQSSSSRALPIPHVPDRHADDMRQFGHRYTAGMRGAPSIPGLPSSTDAPPLCVGERAGGRPHRCAHSRPRSSTRRYPPFTRSDGALLSIERGLQIGAADARGIASALRFRPSAGTVRHRDRPRTGAATVLSGRPDGP